MDFDFKNSLARWYFYITPGFILLDYFLGINVRISALEAIPVYKNLYYGFCVLCGVLMYIIPRYSALIAFIESLINFTLLILIIYLPYIRTITILMDDVIGADFKAIQESLTIDPAINLFIVALCITITLRTSIDRISGSFGFDNQASKKWREWDTN